MVDISTILLALTAIVGSYCCYIFARRSGSFANFRTIVLANFLIVQPLSGIAHLREWGSTRGYFDLLNYPDDYILQATIAAILGMVFLTLGARKPLPQELSPDISNKRSFWATRRDPTIVLLVVLLFGPISLYGLVQMNAIAGGLGTARVIALDGGAARFSFLSHWFTWVVSLTAMLAIYRLPRNKPHFVLFVLGVAVALIAASLSWTGGRSILIVMCLPITLFALPYLRGVRTLAIIIGAVAFIGYAVIISEVRSSSLVSGTGVNFGNWLDWEWGRFSIVGTSLEFVRGNGFLNGQTFLAGLASVAYPILGMLGIQTGSLNLLTSTDISSRVLFGNFDSIYVVPGFTAELVANFGLFAVIPGYFLLGRAAWWVDASLRKHTGGLQEILLFYIGSLLAFRVIAADSASILFYLLYSGGPLLLVNLMSFVWAGGLRRRKQTGAPPVASNGEPANLQQPARARFI